MIDIPAGMIQLPVRSWTSSYSTFGDAELGGALKP